MTIDRTLPPPVVKPWLNCSRDDCDKKFQPYHGRIGCLCDDCHSKYHTTEISSPQLTDKRSCLANFTISLFLAVVLTCTTLFAFTAYNSFYPVCVMLPMNMWTEPEWRIATGSVIILFILFYFGD